ncbi:MAG: YndJ family protein [Nannocystaceae bacterium]|nr:YndJ family protein [Nannocystaceae bacterium]
MTHAAAVAMLSFPVLVTVRAGWVQLRRTARRSALLPEDLMLTLAWVFPLGAAVWLEAWLSNSSRLGFGSPWTWLTASHFMVAGFGALTVSAWMTRTIPTLRARRVMYGLLLLHPLAFAAVALGLTGVPFFDEVGAVAYEALFGIQAVLYLVAARPRGSWLARTLLGVALWIPVATLLPAVAWAWGHPVWSMDEMVAYHGLVNAIGHVGLGLGMLAWLRPPRRLSPVHAPFSGLHSSGRVDASVLGTASAEVTGLTDSLRAYSRPGFNVDRLPPEVIAFYEHTTEFELDLHGQWHGIFVVGGWVWSRIIAPALGQLGLPAPGHVARDAALESRIVDVDDALDGRTAVRGWVRHWKHSHAPLYIAAYAEHQRGDVRSMNIAFALPGGFNMTSILHLEEAPGRALSLSSRPDRHPGGDQGVYLVRSGRPWRLPLDETIVVYTADQAPANLPVAEGSTLVARHRMWLAGIPYLTMHYQIRRRPSA